MYKEWVNVVATLVSTEARSQSARSVKQKSSLPILIRIAHVVKKHSQSKKILQLLPKDRPREPAVLTVVLL